MKARSQRVRSGLEYLIVIVLVVGGLSLFFADAVVTGGPIEMALGSFVAGIIYGTMFITQGALLTYAKWFEKKKLHKHVLMTVYLTTIFIFGLEWALLGWTWYLIDQVILGLVAAWCWLQWKMTTEYLSPREFRRLAEPCRDDLPPSYY